MKTYNWRSWWNYPTVRDGVIENISPTAINVTGGNKEYFFKIEPYNSIVTEVDQIFFKSSKAKIIIPIDVFNSAVNQNMFHHSGISKRNKYVFKDIQSLSK